MLAFQPVRLDLQIRNCNLQIWQSTDLAISRFGTLQIWQPPDLAISRLGNLHILQSPDLAISRLRQSSNFQTFKLSNFQTFKVWTFEHLKVWKCATIIKILECITKANTQDGSSARSARSVRRAGRQICNSADQQNGRKCTIGSTTKKHAKV